MRERKEREGVFGIAFFFLPERQVQQRGEGGVQGRRKRHLATAGLNYPAAECTGACVFASVCVC